MGRWLALGPPYGLELGLGRRQLAAAALSMCLFAYFVVVLLSLNVVEAGALFWTSVTQ